MSRRRRERETARPWDTQRHPIESLGPEEDEIDIEHQYARDQFEHELATQQKGQQQ